MIFFTHGLKNVILWYLCQWTVAHGRGNNYTKGLSQEVRNDFKASAEWPEKRKFSYGITDKQIFGEAYGVSETTAESSAYQYSYMR